MSTAPKKGFSDFIKRDAPAASGAPLAPVPMLREVPPVSPLEPEAQTLAADPAPTAVPERVRQVTSTGRVRTHSASRQLPGVTLRLSEGRWERLKMLSIQERRPIQDILGDAMEAYMKGRGLPW